MKGVILKNQPGALRSGEPTFDKRQITIFVPTVELVADNGMSEVREVDADLMFATSAGEEAQKGKRGW